MPLPTGTRLGPYEVTATLGAGGMGEVYRAHDTRLGRDVAIKVLPPQLAAAPEVRARFEREARTISQLEHPHICRLYDVGREVDTDYLVMELLEGETLACRLEKGALPIAEVLALGAQIADALDRAHRAGVVHRDLKPGNVMLTKSGAKLMDFGLARAALSAAAPGALTESPTVSRPLTREGTIIGTFQYMAPEQLEGGDADARTDLWALGCVLYEMTTGKRAFEGTSQASLISSIMKDEPRVITELQPDPAAPGAPPPALERLVKRCLAKVPDDRWQSARDLMHELEWIATAGPQAGVGVPVRGRRRRAGRIAWALAGALALGIAALGWLVLLRSAPPRVVRFEVLPPPGTLGIEWPRVSPDGRALAFLALDSAGTRSLWIRRLDAVESHRVAAVGDGRPFWSPDGKYLAFFADGRLRKVPAAGGPVIDVCEVIRGGDGTWGRGGWILFDGGPGDSIQGVPASGGAPQPVVSVDRAHGEFQHWWPFFLPDGRHFLFVSSGTGSIGDIRLGTLGSKQSRFVGHTRSRAEYAPPGYIVVVSGSVLMAQSVDTRSARLTGEPVAIGESVAISNWGDFSVSSAGVLAYKPKLAQPNRVLTLARDGRVLGEALPPGSYDEVALSPDGTRLAFKLAGDRTDTRDIWVRDLDRHLSARLTFGPEDEGWPIWSPDGSRIAYLSDLTGTRGVRIRASDGAGAVDSVSLVNGVVHGLYDWSGPANAILFSCLSAKGDEDLWAKPMGAAQEARPLVQGPFTDTDGRFSPDGRWLAYASNESGRFEVYLAPYPGPGAKVQVSTAGGRFPQWRADGRELFFEGAGQLILTSAVSGGAKVVLSAPKPLFKTPLAQGFAACGWSVTRDGQRFIVNASAGRATPDRLVVVTNWTSELKKK